MIGERNVFVAEFGGVFHHFIDRRFAVRVSAMGVKIAPQVLQVDQLGQPSARVQLLVHPGPRESPGGITGMSISA